MTPRWYYIFDNGWAYFQQLPTCSNPKPTDVEGKWINEGTKRNKPRTNLIQV